MQAGVKPLKFIGQFFIFNHCEDAIIKISSKTVELRLTNIHKTIFILSITILPGHFIEKCLSMNSYWQFLYRCINIFTLNTFFPIIPWWNQLTVIKHNNVLFLFTYQLPCRHLHKVAKYKYIYTKRCVPKFPCRSTAEKFLEPATKVENIILDIYLIQFN